MHGRHPGGGPERGWSWRPRHECTCQQPSPHSHPPAHARFCLIFARVERPSDSASSTCTQAARRGTAVAGVRTRQRPAQHSCTAPLCAAADVVGSQHTMAGIQPNASHRVLTWPSRSPSSTTPAASPATAVPPPMATPTSAQASAGASFTPSPTMATRRPSARRLRTNSAFCSGRTPARASSAAMPAAAAMACTASGRSPLSSMTRRPARCSAATVGAASGRSASLSSRRPARPRPVQPTQTSVSELRSRLSLPLLLSSAASPAASDAHRCSTHSRRPTATWRPPTTAHTPSPGAVCELLASGTSRPGRGGAECMERM